MSIRVMSRVWDQSRQSGGALLVLLAIADFADDAGQAFPSVRTLARKARLSDRQVQRVIAQLVAAGELAILAGQGRQGSHSYRVLVGAAPAAAGGDRLSPGGRTSPGDSVSGAGDSMSPPPVTSVALRGVTPASPEPSGPEPSPAGPATPLPPSRTRIQQQGVDEGSAAAHRPTPPAAPSDDQTAAALVEALYRGLGTDPGALTPAIRRRELAIARQLVAAGATPGEAEAYAREARATVGRIAPVDLRSYERERLSWLARWAAAHSTERRLVDRTGQGPHGGQPASRPPTDSADVGRPGGRGTPGPRQMTSLGSVARSLFDGGRP